MTTGLFSLETLARVMQIPLPEAARQSPGDVLGVGTDTRGLQPGELFVALRGERFDGHDFLEVAQAQGAIAAVVQADTLPQWNHGPLTLPLFPVADTLAAYQALAHWWRQQFKVPVVAITGSVGKTSTKELTAAVLRSWGPVLKTEANHNNEIGLPQTLLKLRSHHRAVVLELAMRGRGQIACLTQIAQPDIGVIVNVGTAHLGLLGSEEAIAQAKCELLAEMPPTGVAVLNHDHQRLLETAATVWQGKTLTYGLGGGDLRGELLEGGTHLRVNHQTLPLPLVGRHQASNFLAALAVAQVLGIDWKTLPHPLEVSLPGGRAMRYELPGDILLLDETYNAGVESMAAALQLLMDTPGKRHLAVLGTMKELGDRSLELHERVGETVRDLGCDGLFILADPPEASALAQGATPVPTQAYTTGTELVQALMTIVQPGDRILFKASRAVALDQVVEQFRQGFRV